MISLLMMFLHDVHAAHPFETCTLTVTAGAQSSQIAPFKVEFDEVGAVTYRARIGAVEALIYNNRGQAMDFKRAPRGEARAWFYKDHDEYFTVQLLDDGNPVSGSGTPFDDDHRAIFSGRGIATEEDAFELIRQHNPEMRLHQTQLDRDADGNVLPPEDPRGRMAYIDCATPQF